MIVVTGATGNVGGPLVAALAAADEEVVAVSRRTPRDALPPGVRHRQADLTDPQGLRSVLDGAAAAFLHDGGAGGHGLDADALLGAVTAAGVGRVVLLSSQGVATRPDSASHGRALRTLEDAVRRAGVAWTVLRPAGFASNAFAWAESVRGLRTAAAPFADVGLPVVDPADIAEVAAAALRDDRHAGRVYELTGPTLSTPRERAEAIARAVGEPIRFVEQTPGEARAQMLQSMPGPLVETTLAILGAPTPDEQRVRPDVARVLGRAPRTFDEWAARHAAAFR